LQLFSDNSEKYLNNFQAHSLFIEENQMRPLTRNLLVGSILVFLLLPSIINIVPVHAATKITVGPNIDVSNLPGSQEETTIAIDSNNPNQIVAASNNAVGDSNFLDGPGNTLNMTAYYSSDGGATWKSTFLPTPPLPTTSSPGLTYRQMYDPSVAWDTKGNVYISSSVYFIGYNNPLVSASSEIAVSKSADGGHTWSTTGLNIFGGGLSPLQDKTAIAIDSNPASPFKDNIYVTWGQFHFIGRNCSCHFDTFLSRSTDNGATFSSPVHPAGQTVGSTISTPTSLNPFIGPDGTLYVAWDDPTKGIVAVSSSTDGGQTFGPAVTIGSSPAPADWIPGTYPYLSNGNALVYPSCGADISAGSHRGTLYCSWIAETPSSGTDIFASHSTDQGKTWSPRLRVNDDPTGVVKDQYNQWLAVDPINGRVSMSWYDPRNDPAGQAWDVFYATSTDGGVTFSPNVKITTAPTAEQTTDYEGIAAYGGVVHPVWADRRASVNASGLQWEIFTATITFGDTSKLDQVPSPLTPNMILLATLLATATLAFNKRKHD
jgi:BNR/Asp-box repeat protein